MKGSPVKVDEFLVDQLIAPKWKTTKFSSTHTHLSVIGRNKIILVNYKNWCPFAVSGVTLVQVLCYILFQAWTGKLESNFFLVGKHRLSSFIPREKISDEPTPVIDFRIWNWIGELRPERPDGKKSATTEPNHMTMCHKTSALNCIERGIWMTLSKFSPLLWSPYKFYFWGVISVGRAQVRSDSHNLPGLMKLDNLEMLYRPSSITHLEIWILSLVSWVWGPWSNSWYTKEKDPVSDQSFIHTQK